MPHDVLVRKLTFLRQLLRDLARYADATQADVIDQHYAVERILELLVGAASDLLFHQLAERGVQADSYRAAFRLAAQHGLLPDDLATRLQQAAGMRNILVHQYEIIDYGILYHSIGPALRDFAQFVALAEGWDAPA